MSNIVITGKDLTLEQIALICRENVKIELAEEAKQNIIESRKVVDDLVAEEKVVYGITTGFGKFSDVVIFSGPVQGSSEKPDHHSCGRCW